MPFLVYFLIGKITALSIGIYYFKSLPRAYRLVLYFIGITILFESLGYYIAVYLNMHNSWLFNIYILTDVWMMGLAAINLVAKRNLKLFFWILVLASTILWVVYIIINSIYIFANLVVVIDLTVLTIIYTAVLLTNSIFSSKQVLSQPIFWLSISVILFCACDIPYISLLNYLNEKAPTMARQLDKINSILDIVRYPLAAISFILLGRQNKIITKAA